MPIFDLHVSVDWSAAATPTLGRDSIWTAARAVGHGPPNECPEALNHPTRHAAIEHLDQLLRRWHGRRVLIGIDVTLGLPAGAADRLVPDDPMWRAVWSTVTALAADDERNRNNRFEVGAELNRRIGAAEGPFWGCPPGRVVDGLRPTRPRDEPLDRFRRVEHLLRARGLRPFSVWQLAYAGSVGGQTLTAIPALTHLRHRHPDRVRIWPFERPTRPSASRWPADAVVIAEVWPSALDVDRRRHRVLDAAQVLTSVETTAEADRVDELAEWIDVDLDDAALTQEGWVLGVGPEGECRWRG